MRLYNVEETGQLLGGIGEKVVRGLIRAGLLQTLKLGPRLTMISDHEIDRFISQNDGKDLSERFERERGGRHDERGKD